jgi:hypothetical protein
LLSSSHGADELIWRLGKGFWKEESVLYRLVPNIILHRFLKVNMISDKII